MVYLFYDCNPNFPPAMTEAAALTEADFRANPVLFVELAHEWAAGGMPPTVHHEEWLAELARPCLLDPAQGREALWGALSYPERGRALAWLDQTGLLGELLPVWRGNAARRALRLAAVEEIHLERWASGLGSVAYEWLCVYQDQRVGRLGGWAMTAFSTLLLEGDEPLATFIPRVEADLKALGALPVESKRVIAAIHEYAIVTQAITSNDAPLRRPTPQGIVAALSSLLAMPELSMSQLRDVIHRSGELLMGYAAPHTEPAPRRKPL